jgi:hypothetical protein
MAMSGLTSAAPLLAYLSEQDPALRSFALNKLNQEVDLLWPEISGSVSQMYVVPHFCMRDLMSHVVRLCAKMIPFRRDSLPLWSPPRYTFISVNTMKV